MVQNQINPFPPLAVGFHAQGENMLGDVLVIEDKHRKAAHQILEKMQSLKTEKIVLAIGGESGSGKSEIAHVIARGLKAQGTPAKILHSDNYYKITPQDRKRWRLEHGLESVGSEEYDWELIDEHITAFRDDQEHVSLPCVDLLTDQIDLLQTSFQGLKYLIIEGLYAVKAEADLRILIELTYHETKNMQKKRGKEPVNEYRWQVLEQEHQAVQSLRPFTDLLVTEDFNLKEIQ